MTDTYDPINTRNNLLRSFTRITSLYSELHWQAEASTNDRLFPGGEALNMMASAYAPQDWRRVFEYVEAGADGDDVGAWADAQDETHPVTVLGYWVHIIRELRNQQTSAPPTLASELGYLANNIDWITRPDVDGNPQWSGVVQLERDVHAVVRRVENVLGAGRRIDTDAAPCFRDMPDGERCGGTLARVTLQRRVCEHVRMSLWFADDDPTLARRILTLLTAYYPHLQLEHRSCDQGGRDDIYRCLKCSKPYTNTEYWLAVADHLERRVV